MNIHYLPEIPESLLPIVQERIEAVQDLFPDWCHELTIGYESDDENLASCDPKHHYRTVLLNIHPPFFADPDWEHSLTHEIQHSLLDPLARLAANIVESFVPDEQTRHYLLKQLAEAEELTCEDLSIFAKKLGRKRRKW